MMKMLLGMADGERPLDVFSHSVNFPGVPLETTINSVGMLLNMYGITHDLPVNPLFDIGTLQTGDEGTDSRIATDYIHFKTLLDNLQRDYRRIECHCQSNMVCVYLRFSCYA